MIKRDTFEDRLGLFDLFSVTELFKSEAFCCYLDVMQSVAYDAALKMITLKAPC